MKTPELTELKRSLTVLHMALCMGCAGFLAVQAYLWNEGTIPMGRGDAEPLKAVGLLMAVAFPVLSVVLFRRRVRALLPGSGSVAVLRAACILHWVLIEGALFFNLVVFMLTADRNTAGAALLLLAFLVLRAPTERRIDRWSMGTP